MFDWSSWMVTFDRPAWLLALFLIPAVWAIGARSLAALGRKRRGLALALRTALLLLLVAALAEIRFVQTTRQLTVMYLVDRSLSIPHERLGEVIRFVNATGAHRQGGRGDRVGVISFGGEAAVDMPPWRAAPALGRDFETEIVGDQSNLAAALRLAHAAFPPDAAKRVVIVSDGNETLGDALSQARQMAAAGVSIDVVPIRYASRTDVAVERVVTPTDARLGTPFDIRVVLTHQSLAGDSRPVSGRLVVHRRFDGRTELVASQQVSVAPGKQVFNIREELGGTGFFSYEAEFIPDESAGDAFVQNNRAMSSTLVRGQGRVLLVVDSQRPGEFDALAEMLRREQIDVVVQPSDQLFLNLGELQAFDVIVLANVARSSGGEADEISIFTDDQLRMLAENTRQMGAGLVMIGGPDSFAAGGWTNTPVEEAMPVDFQIKNSKVVPVGALMLVIDSSGSMQGEKIEICKAAAREAIRVLGDRDYFGVVSFDSEARSLVPMQRAANRDRAISQIGRLAAGGGTDMHPGMLEGYRQLRRAEAAVKHMIVLSDGQTMPADLEGLARRMQAEKITVTTVGVGDDADVGLLQRLATIGQGKFYKVRSPRSIPRIFMREARRVAQPVIYEDERGFTPSMVDSHEILSGIREPLPPLTGFVMTRPKENALVEVPLVSPAPAGQNHPILAAWQYGLGRSVAFTTDGGQRWASQWSSWPEGEKLLLQTIRWSMRTTRDVGQLTLAADVQDQQVRVVLNALDQDDQFLNSLVPLATAVAPDLEPQSISLRQEAPGRYVGTFDAPQPGAWLLAVSPGAGLAPLRASVSVGYSDEFRRHQENLELLKELAALEPRGGQPGRVIELDDYWLANQNATTSAPGAEAELADAPATRLVAGPGRGPLTGSVVGDDLFRFDLAPARNTQPGWHLLVAAACGLFLLDVANRRVAWSISGIFAPLAARWRTWRARRAAADETPRLQRLRNRKAELREEELRRAQGREFVAERPIAPTSEPDRSKVAAPSSGATSSQGSPSAAPSIAPLAAEPEPLDAFQRLRQAKAQATTRNRDGEP